MTPQIVMLSRVKCDIQAMPDPTLTFRVRVEPVEALDAISDEELITRCHNQSFNLLDMAGEALHRGGRVEHLEEDGHLKVVVAF